MDGLALKPNPALGGVSLCVDFHPAELQLRHRNCLRCASSEKLTSDIMTLSHPEFLFSEMYSGNAVKTGA